jgi:hypothetical protein
MLLRRAHGLAPNRPFGPLRPAERVGEQPFRPDEFQGEQGEPGDDQGDSRAGQDEQEGSDDQEGERPEDHGGTESDVTLRVTLAPIPQAPDDPVVGHGIQGTHG